MTTPNQPTLDARGLPPATPLRPDLEVTPRDAHAALTQHPEHTLLVDVRLASEWDIARVPGSVHIPLHELENRWDELDCEGKQVLVLCHHGRRSIDGAYILRSKGILNAKSVAGGIEIWSLGVDPTVPRYGRQGERVWRV